MSDRTPADVIAEAFTGVLHQGWTRNLAASSVLATLAAAGFRVVPIPDDNTRAEVAEVMQRLRDMAAVWHPTPRGLNRAADLLSAAYLDGQPQDRPATCPMCGSDDPMRLDHPCESYGLGISPMHETDPWHTDGRGNTR